MIKKVLFIQPFSLIDEHLSNILLTWPMYLENYLRFKCSNLEFDILYLPIEQKKKKIHINAYSKDQINLFETQMNNLISKLKFDIDDKTIICISCTFSSLVIPTKWVVRFFNKYFHRAIIILGGIHISVLNKDHLDDNLHIDYFIQGEGEVPLYDLIKKGLGKRKNRCLIKNQLLSNLDELPILNLSDLSIVKYLKYSSNLSISLSRGCPFNCHFCIEKTLSYINKDIRRWRVYSPSRAFNEVKNMIETGEKYGIKEYGFIDSIFGMNRNWVDKFLDLYNFEDYKSIWIETRLDIMNEKLITKLSKKRFYNMYGLESLSPTILKIMNKTNNSKKYIDKFWNILDIHKKLEHTCAVNIIIAHPGETNRSLKTTFNDLEKIMIEDNEDKIYLNIRYYHHYPGTYIYNHQNEFKERYGTIFYPISKDWWNSNNISVQRFAPMCIKPSTKLSLRTSINTFIEKYLRLNKYNLEKLKKNKLDPFALLQKAIIIKKTNSKLIGLANEYLNFLDFFKVEMI